MKFLEDMLLSILEFAGFEVSKFALGELFPAALIGLFPAAIIGGIVSDWKFNQGSLFSKFPWDWLASLLAMIGTICLYCWLFLSS